MKLRDIQKKAKAMGIQATRMGKVELIRTIQGQEKSIPCYGSDRVAYCEEKACLWREDCVSLSNKKPSQGS